MKPILFSLVCILFTSLLPQKAAAQGEPVGFQVFYDELSPYGTWIDTPEYGYVWMPNVAPGFTPYATNGYWVYTDAGWAWFSNYAWGWAPFHYGRWYTDAIYGPMWVPGNEWGPGWVSWRHSNDYYGWAPIGPGIGYDGGYDAPSNHWTFVRGRRLGGTNIQNYYIKPANNVTIYNNTTVINNVHVDKGRNTTYNAGPDRGEVEKHRGRTISPVAVSENNRPGQDLKKDKMNIYRPQVQKSNATDPRPAPSKITDVKDVKTKAQRTTEAAQNRDNQPRRQPQQVPQRTENQVQPPERQPQINAPQKGRENRPLPPVKSAPRQEPQPRTTPATKPPIQRQQPQQRTTPATKQREPNHISEPPFQQSPQRQPNTIPKKKKDGL